MLTTWHPLSAKVDTNFANKRRSFLDSGHGVFIGKHLSDNFPIQSDPKQRNVLLKLLHFALENAIRKAQENQMGWNYADGVYLL
jgi:hypothetical protein